PKVRDYLVKSNQSANSLLGVINDILDFSKIEAGKLNIENIDFELEVVIANVLNLVSMDADKKNIEIILSIAPDVPVSIIGDPMRLEQVLTNIVNNAVKFTETGEIVVAVRVLSRGQDNNVRLNFQVKDTGIGMSESQLTGLFREFSQADGSVTRKYGGTGLGLAISQRLVELMGSHIEVESKIDEGSCFSFDLDFSLSNVFRSKKRPLSVNLKGLRCLVVDDNAAAQQVLEEMLTSLGFLVKCVDSGELAINTLEESSPKDDFQLVIVDWKMPGMGGLETIKRIKASNKIKFAPACMMVSIYNHRDIEKVAVDVDADAFLEKPVRPSALFDSIIEIFTKKPLAGSIVHNIDYLNPANKALFSGCKILLAEDNLLNQELANELLLESGADVTVVDNGLDAINACKGTTFDLILMDIQMPDMDGLEATRKIRELEGQKGSKSRDKHVPIVAMTAHAMKGDREKSLDAGMDEHITKPIVPLEFYETLKKWLGKKSEKSESLIGDPNKDKEALTGVDQIISSAKPGNNEWLIDLDGIDTKSGFELNLSDVDFYKRNLHRFHQFSGDSYSGFESAYTNNDLSEAKRFSHSLKSSAAQIGAEDLRQIAQKIETATQAIDNIKSIEPLFFQLKTEYERVMKSISVLDEKSTNTPDDFNVDKNRSILSTDEFKTAIFRLRDAILRQEFEANIRLEECHEELAECVDRVLVNNLAEALKNFEYQKAMTIFDDIQNKMEFR
ncbi:MAG: response regulator, partial [Gammaproteobacteria bacterium]|nr:response regulator [Gammaproteobacteria bacterium]